MTRRFPDKRSKLGKYRYMIAATATLITSCVAVDACVSRHDDFDLAASARHNFRLLSGLHCSKDFFQGKISLSKDRLVLGFLSKRGLSRKILDSQQAAVRQRDWIGQTCFPVQRQNDELTKKGIKVAIARATTRHSENNQVCAAANIQPHACRRLPRWPMGRDVDQAPLEGENWQKFQSGHVAHSKGSYDQRRESYEHWKCATCTEAATVKGPGTAEFIQYASKASPSIQRSFGAKRAIFGWFAAQSNWRITPGPAIKGLSCASPIIQARLADAGRQIRQNI